MLKTHLLLLAAQMAMCGYGPCLTVFCNEDFKLLSKAVAQRISSMRMAHSMYLQAIAYHSLLCMAHTWPLLAATVLCMSTAFAHQKKHTRSSNVESNALVKRATKVLQWILYP